jgi:hypothetical protein
MTNSVTEGEAGGAGPPPEDHNEEFHSTHDEEEDIIGRVDGAYCK